MSYADGMVLSPEPEMHDRALRGPAKHYAACSAYVNEDGTARAHHSSCPAHRGLEDDLTDEPSGMEGGP